MGQFKNIMVAAFCLIAGCASSGEEQVSKDRGDKPKKSPEELATLWYERKINDFLIQIPTSLSAFETEKLSRHNQTLSMLGREDLVAAPPHPGYPQQVCAAGPGIDPVDAIIDGARKTNIVIINEAHDNSRHRAFIEQVALALQDEGYTHFAAETFTHVLGDFPFEMNASPDKPYIANASGYYIFEPVFGRMLRRLKSVGFIFVAYEGRPDQYILPEGAPVEDSIAEREEAQAVNLIAKIFGENPDTKVIIHVGFSHASEEVIHVNTRSIKWMAARLKEKTGIDPLTISQTHCSGNTETTRLSTVPTKLNEEGKASVSPAHFDLAIDHPIPTYTKNRPDWRRANADEEVSVPSSLLPKDKRVIIEAWYADEPLYAVAMDRVLIFPGENIPLLLPPGKFRLEARTIEGLYGQPETIWVEPENRTGTLTSSADCLGADQEQLKRDFIAWRDRILTSTDEAPSAALERLRLKWQAAITEQDNFNAEVMRRVVVDQFHRIYLNPSSAEATIDASAACKRGINMLLFRATDQANTQWLKNQLDEKGSWWKISEVGESITHDLWLLVQHADMDHDFQRRVLALMEPLLAQDEMSPRLFAYLYDRVASAEKRPQRFGTQGRCQPDGVWRPNELEDAENIDQIREDVGLVSMKEYQSHFKSICPQPKKG